MQLRSKKKWLLYIGSAFFIAAIIVIAILDFQLREKFDGKRWELPSLVYGRPLELYVGSIVDPKLLEMELTAADYRRLPRADRPGSYSRRGGQFSIYRRDFQFSDGNEEALKINLTVNEQLVTSLSGESGEELPIVRLEPLRIGGIYPDRFEDRKLIRLEQAPKYLIDALIVTEDQNFYEHFGIAPKAILRAVWANFKAGAYVQGASTITQQLVKNFYLTSERSLKRKLLEALYSLLLEIHYSKDEILEAYLNEVYLGQQGDRSINGFGLGSEFYFDRSIEDLSLAQAALMVAVINGPSYYNPRRFPERTKERRDAIIAKMLDKGLVTEEEASKAQKTRLKLQAHQNATKNRYPAFLDLVKRHLQRDYETKDLQVEGLRIFTSFDPHTEWEARKAIQTVLRNLGSQKKDLEAAVVVTSGMGDVEAIIGSQTFEFAGFNRALDSQRSIGSLVKPFILLAAFMEDDRFKINTRVDDGPIEIKLDDGKVWNPNNFDLESHGEIEIYKALANSYNQAMVRLGMEVSTEKVAKVMEKLGVSESIPTNPAMLLGAFGLSPFEVVSMFQTIASGGFKQPLRSVRYVLNNQGEVLSSNPPEVEKIYDANYIHLVQYAMQAVMQEGTGRSAYNFLPADLYSAGKTGTSNDKRDSWFAGYTGDKLAVVWMGRDDHESTNLTGSSGALQVWARMMAKVSRQAIRLEVPDGINYQWVDTQSGLASFEFCQDVKFLPFLKGTEPEEFGPCIRDVEPIVDWIKKLFD